MCAYTRKLYVPAEAGCGTSVRGFTLIELMIVVAIIAIITGIALPHLQEAKRNANECSAISSLRTISSTIQAYRSSSIPPAYADTLASLTIAGGGNNDYIDEELASGSKSGYTFSLSGATSTYQCTAGPIGPSYGGRAFFVDHTGIIRQVAGAGPATANDNPIQ